MSKGLLCTNQREFQSKILNSAEVQSEHRGLESLIVQICPEIEL